MHSPKDAAVTSRQPFRRANHFSFPPTQRTDLLDATDRFADQKKNLEHSFRKLLDATNVHPLQQAEAR